MKILGRDDKEFLIQMIQNCLFIIDTAPAHDDKILNADGTLDEIVHVPARTDAETLAILRNMLTITLEQFDEAKGNKLNEAG